MVVTLTSERWIGPGCTSRRPRSGATSLRRILAMERQPAIAGRPRWAATASDSRPRPRGHGPVAGGEHGREVRGAEWRRLARGPDRRRSAGSRRGREPVRARLRAAGRRAHPVPLPTATASGVARRGALRGGEPRNGDNCGCSSSGCSVGRPRASWGVPGLPHLQSWCSWRSCSTIGCGVGPSVADRGGGT